MKLEYKKSESAIMPELVDSTSSKKYVYIRRNIVQKTGEQDGVEYNYYEYDEAKLTKEEYERYLKELAISDIQQQRADIDYILLMMEG